MLKTDKIAAIVESLVDLQAQVKLRVGETGGESQATASHSPAEERRHAATGCTRIMDRETSQARRKKGVDDALSSDD